MDDEQKVAEALELIEAAQNLVLTAAQKLCPVDGMGREWSATCKLYDRIKAHWHRVEQRRQGLKVKGRLGKAEPQNAHTGR